MVKDYLVVNQEDYSESRLMEEGEALVQCQKERKGRNYKCGQFFLAIGMRMQKALFDPKLPPTPIISLVNLGGYSWYDFSGEDFAIVSDPAEVLKKKYTEGIMNWRYKRLERIDKSQNEVTDEYLISERRALVRYYPEQKEPQQMLAVRHSGTHFVDVLGKDGRTLIVFAEKIEYLSDPLGLLNPMITSWGKPKLRGRP